jgi:hypothetical protein
MNKEEFILEYMEFREAWVEKNMEKNDCCITDDRFVFEVYKFYKEQNKGGSQ